MRPHGFEIQSLLRLPPASPLLCAEYFGCEVVTVEEVSVNTTSEVKNREYKDADVQEGEFKTAVAGHRLPFL